MVFFGVILLFVGQGCFTPMNMSYDTAKPVGKKQATITAAYGPSSDQIETLFGSRNFVANNYMVRMGFGLSDKTSLYGGYYRKNSKASFQARDWLSETLSALDYKYNHMNVGLKFSLNEQKTLALKTMFGGYMFGDDFDIFSGYLAFIYTKEFNKHVEFSTVLHSTIFSSAFFVPGVNFNAGFSTDRSKWVIRPEVGLTTHSATAGVGVELKLGKKPF